MKTLNLLFCFCKIILIVELLSCVTAKEQCFHTNSVYDDKTQKAHQDCSGIKNKEAVLMRRKRAVLFPTGTKLLITASLVKAILVGIPLGWNVALELDVFYEMHKEEQIIEHNVNFIKLHHKQRREVWDHMEGVLKVYGLEGRPCIFRAICEAQKYLAPKDTSLVHDMLNLIFSAPIEDGPRDEYTVAHETENCETYHEECPFSILELLLSYQRV